MATNKTLFNHLHAIAQEHIPDTMYYRVRSFIRSDGSRLEIYTDDGYQLAEIHAQPGQDPNLFTHTDMPSCRTPEPWQAAAIAATFAAL